jgi:16S rRNA (uracil1498-N3)-methyltransferase
LERGNVCLCFPKCDLLYFKIRTIDISDLKEFMPAERYYVNNPLIEEEIVILEDKEFHHLAHVMRGSVGDSIELVNGEGSLAEALIQKLEKKRALLKVKNSTRGAKPKFEIILAQALPRMNRLDFILEKGTELGMTEIWLFPGELGEKQKITTHQRERMQGLTIAAIKQCGRLYLPKIVLLPTILNWKKLAYPSYFGDTTSDADIFPSTQDKSKAGVIFFVGPESGFSNSEIQKLQDLKSMGVKLHPNILRTDTAAITALTLISHSLL